jgi:pentatricopeptide repeat protein
VQTLWKQMLRSGIVPTNSTCRQVLAACYHKGDINAALAVYSTMKQAKIRPDNRALLSLVKLCEAEGLHDVARKIMSDRSSGSSSTR